MTVEELQTAIARLTTSEWDQLLTWVVTDEKYRRDAQPAVVRAQTDIITEMRDAGKLDKPESTTVAQAVETPDAVPEWVDPGTSHDRMYTEGNVVRHNGKVWKSITDLLNSWEPGNDNGLTWRDITAQLQPDYDPDAPQPFVQPTGAHDAYSIGDRVVYNGKVYRSLIAGNAYSPDAYPAGWELEN